MHHFLLLLGGVQSWALVAFLQLKLVTYIPSQYKKIRPTPAGITKSSVKIVTDSKLSGPPQMLLKPSMRRFNLDL